MSSFEDIVGVTHISKSEREAFERAPSEYIIAKAVQGDDRQLSMEEKDFIAALTKKVLFEDMKY